MNFKQQAREMKCGLHNFADRTSTNNKSAQEWYNRRSMSKQLREERARLFPKEIRTPRADNTKG